MFHKSFKCRIDGYDVRVRQQKGNNEDERTIRLHLLYEFTEDMAEEIGGPAPQVYKTMTTKYDNGKVGAVPIQLSARAVNVRFKTGNKIAHTIKDTTALDVSVRPPNKSNLSPMLEAKVTFLGTEEDAQTLYRNSGQHLSTKMDRKQLELPMTAKDEKELELQQRAAEAEAKKGEADVSPQQ